MGNVKVQWLRTSRLPGNLDVREILNPLFEKYDVDIVFNGHEHYYARMKEMNGVIYIITAGGGAPIYDAIAQSYSVEFDDEHHFCTVDIDGYKLSLRNWISTATVWTKPDRFRGM